MTLHVAWIGDTERVEAHDADALLVLPDADDANTHRLYWHARDGEHLAKLCAVAIGCALDSGAWPLAMKIVRDNPSAPPDATRGSAWPPMPFLTAKGLDVSARTRALVDALVTAVAAGARSQDGSHVAAMASARTALLAHLSKLEGRSR